MRHSPLRSKQRSKNLYPSITLLMLISLHTLMIAPKHVMMFLIPKAKIIQRIGATHQRSYISAVTSMHMIQHHMDNFLNPTSHRRISLSSTTDSEDSDKKSVVITTSEMGEKSSEELEAVQAAREARKYVLPFSSMKLQKCWLSIFLHLESNPVCYSIHLLSLEQKKND
jgi:hypothetical protein